VPSGATANARTWLSVPALIDVHEAATLSQYATHLPLSAKEPPTYTIPDGEIAIAKTVSSTPVLNADHVFDTGLYRAILFADVVPAVSNSPPTYTVPSGAIAIA
jgi:hypothetical protein